MPIGKDPERPIPAAKVPHQHREACRMMSDKEVKAIKNFELHEVSTYTLAHTHTHTQGTYANLF